MKHAPSRQQQPQRAMTVAGIMSGTSADGIDVAFVRIAPGVQAPRLKLLQHLSQPYPSTLRKHVLDLMNASNASVADLSRLHWRLGQVYAAAVLDALQKHPIKLDLIGCHGQTLYHQGTPQRYLGAPVACTWQMGEASVLAAQTGVTVVSDFRPADIAAGGQGAPLVPLLDWVYFRHEKRNRVLQNLGGIGNVTVIPAAAQCQQIFAFDTGPANMVIDAMTEVCFQKRYDQGGRIAARGRVLDGVLEEFLSIPYFSAAPPKSAGREEFGREFADRFLKRCQAIKGSPEDAVATATALTSSAIRLAWERFVWPALAPAPTDFIVAGGGAKNPVLMQSIASVLERYPVHITKSDSLGVPAKAKESVAFALLAYQTWHHLAGNIPKATGAKRPAVLGKVTYA
jgi:anhydro-N-acetylmuramic acid kinase